MNAYKNNNVFFHTIEKKNPVAKSSFSVIKKGRVFDKQRKRFFIGDDMRICPFTFESVEGCQIRKTLGREVCAYSLEFCLGAPL